MAVVVFVAAAVAFVAAAVPAVVVVVAAIADSDEKSLKPHSKSSLQPLAAAVEDSHFEPISPFVVLPFREK